MFCNNSTQAQTFPQWTAKPKSLAQENDNSFKTSNSKIFPSLNPLGSFYKQRKTTPVHPNPSFQGHSEVPQPVKKQRLNTGSETVVNQAPESAQGRAPAFQCQIDKDGFRIPQLPKRLMQKRSEKKTQMKVEEKVVQKKAQKPQKKVVEQQLTVQDDSMKGFNDLQLSLIDFLQLDRPENKSQIEIPMIAQSNEISAAIYERLSLEYYSMILKQNIDHLTQLSKNAEKLLENHNIHPNMYNNYSMGQSIQLC